MRERTIAPDLNALDLWVESVAAGLYVVGISLVLLPQEATASSEAMESCCNEFCRDAAAAAGVWMNQLVQVQNRTIVRKGSISFDFRDHIVSSLVSYFDIYFTSVEQEGVSHSEARARSLRSGLGIVSRALSASGVLVRTDESRWVQEVVNQCLKLVQDLPEYAR